MNTDLQTERNTFGAHSKENNHNYNNRIINDFRSSYDPYYEQLEDFKKKNDVEIENVGGKDRIIININKTKEKDKKNLKHYKSEYIWAKAINRIAEKRIFSDKNYKTYKPYNNNTVNYNNNLKNNLDDNIYKDNNNNNDKEIQNEPNKETIKVDLIIENEDNKENDNKKDLINNIENKEDKDKETPIKNRYNSNIMNQKKEEDDKYKNIPINNVENPNKNLNKNYRYKREFKNYNTVKTPKKEEIIIEKKTYIKIEDENIDNNEKEKDNIE